MTSRACQNPRCGQPLPGTRRAQARTCSTRCRVALHRHERKQAANHPIPAAMRDTPRWVRYTRAKMPLTPEGRAASSTDPNTWATYEQAAASTIGAGHGFVLNGDGIVCIDLDNCLTGNQLAPWAKTILDQAPDTYVEISASGKGLHIFGTGHVEKGRRIRRDDGANIEVYPNGRYIAVTGRPYRKAPNTLTDLTGLLNTIL